MYHGYYPQPIYAEDHNELLTWLSEQFATVQTPANGKPLSTILRLFSDSPGDFRLRLYDTDIVQVSHTGAITLKAGVHRTVTTAEAIRNFLPEPWRLFPERGVWQVRQGWDGKSHTFADGITLYPSGTVRHAGGDIAVAQKRDRKAKARVKTYVNGYMDTLFAGKVGKPGPGDCFLCCVGVSEDKNKEVFLHDDHIDHHIQERYYVPRLLMEAIELHPVSPIARHWLGGAWGYCEAYDLPNDSLTNLIRCQLSASLRKTCYASLGLVGR